MAEKEEIKEEQKTEDIPDLEPVDTGEIKELPEKPEGEVIEPIEETKEVKKREKETINKEAWKPKTEIGKKVKNGIITNIDEIIDNGLKIQEAEITELLLPDLESELLMIGQSKGKFGGGQKRVFKQTQKKTCEGNKPSFATLAIVGNNNGYVGLGSGKARETVPAREKAFRKAKLNIIKIRRGCGSWACGCKEPHSIPFAVEAKCGSVSIRLMPAPKGTGLCIEGECAKILKIAGVKDVWSKTKGHTATKLNLITSCFKALRKLMETKIKTDYVEKLGISEGALKNE